MLAVIATAAALHGTLVVSDRSELRLRDSHEPTGRAIDLDTAPGATLRMTDRRWEVEAFYGPRFTALATNVDLESDVTLLHRGRVGVAWHDENVRIGTTEEVMYGQESFATLTSALPANGLPRLDVLPPPTTIDYVRSRSAVLATVALSRRTTFLSGLEYWVEGGTNEPSRRVLPLHKGPRIEEIVEYRLSRRDRVSSAIVAQRLVFSSGPEDTIVEASERWSHSIDRVTETSLRVGSALAAEKADSASSVRYTAHPVVEARITHELLSHLQMIGEIAVAPIVDRVSGAVDERMDARLASMWWFFPHMGVRAIGGVTRSVPIDKSNSVSFAVGEAAFIYQPSPEVRAELGTRAAWQGVGREDSGPALWTAFVALTLSTRPLEL